jgi:hypothetical protein
MFVHDLCILVFTCLHHVEQQRTRHALYNIYIHFSESVPFKVTASVVWWSEFLAANPEVPRSIPGATKFSE